MTFCETLKSGKTPFGREVVAHCENGYGYSVLICEGALAIMVLRCARTTWRKRFKEATEGCFGL